MRRIPDEERDSVVDWAQVLLAERIRHKDPTAAFNRRLRQLLSELLWKFSEANGKYGGCRYWSVSAIESRKKHGAIVTSYPKVGGDALRHEHLFPRAQLIERLFSLTDPTTESIRAELTRLNIGVVVTEREHRLLSDEGALNDPWKRYRIAGVEWVDTWEGEGK